MDGRTLDRKDRSRPSLHWVSQTIGPGRGLELLFVALDQVDVALDVHLRGNLGRGGARWLSSAFPARRGHRLHVHQPVPPDELLSRLAEHDIGIALEQRSPPSRDLTITNKILHYLLGGLAIVASATAGQAEVAAQAPGAIQLLGDASPGHLAAVVSDLAGDRGALVAAKRASLRAAEKTFSWERQVAALLTAVDQALAVT